MKDKLVESTEYIKPALLRKTSNIFNQLYHQEE